MTGFAGMTPAGSTGSRWHVLLVAIDAYAQVPPLNGCVNDVDAIETILLDRLGVPPAAVIKLVAAHPWQDRRPRLPEGAPTHANLRGALEALSGERVQPADRVFIYYAGHGTQVLPSGSRVVREALVPWDADAGGALLYDCELSGLLGRIAARTGDLTVVLDCCCSAGATRSAMRVPRSAVRFCTVGRTPVPPPPGMRGGAEPAAGLLGSVDPSDPGYLVAAACQANEEANEALGQLGRAHGAFTAALLDLIGAQPDSVLGMLRWADIWQALRHRVAAQHLGQHPWLIGRAERGLFGGPFRPQDPGYPIYAAEKTFYIGAGTMVGLTRGARVAVYGPAPDFFPPLGTPQDIAARIGELEVVGATPSSCTATPVGRPFALLQGARGRSIAPGEHDALVVRLVPYDAGLAQWLQAQGPFRVIPPDGSAGGGEVAEACAGLGADGRLWIGDSLFGPDDASRQSDPPLAWTAAGDYGALVRGLIHYAKYNLPLRLARRCRDLPDALAVRVLDCRRMGANAATPMQDTDLPEVRADPEHRTKYLLEHGQPICIAVENRSRKRLYVNLFNCATSGRVEMLGTTQVETPPGRQQLFWMFGQVGRPFRCSVPAGRATAVDRLLAVGSTAPDVDLSFLKEPRSFEEAMAPMTRQVVGPHEPRELWTATLLLLRIIR